MRPAAKEKSLFGPSRLRFLNEAQDINEVDWDNDRLSALWRYNLHYFDDLTAAGASDRRKWQTALIGRWIAENPPGQGIGWDPYPTSLRIVNWIKFSLGGNDLPPEAIDNLAIQVRWLERRIERHLLGNHLFANAKALLFAGLFFDGDEANRWKAKGEGILAREIGEQILSDGGHFERSPMYHSIILEDVLDLINAARSYSQDRSAFFASLPSIADAMRRWLREMCHLDGDIAFFNDAAFGIAAKPMALEAYAERLELPALAPVEPGLRHLDASGYVCIDMNDARAILDLAPIGPDYQPGHAHADSLSFELSVDGRRVIVNGGTSTYSSGPQRRHERSTAAHSTLEIDRADSSEVWADFRVARRARIFDVVIDGDRTPTTVTALHDGYRRLSGRPLHRRTWRFERRRITITDEIDGKYRQALVRFHLGRGVIATADPDRLSGTLTVPQGRKLDWRTSARANIVPSQWHPEFGLTVPIECLAIPFEGAQLKTEISW